MIFLKWEARRKIKLSFMACTYRLNRLMNSIMSYFSQSFIDQLQTCIQYNICVQVLFSYAPLFRYFSMVVEPTVCTASPCCIRDSNG